MIDSIGASTVKSSAKVYNVLVEDYSLMEYKTNQRGFVRCGATLIEYDGSRTGFW